jgi:hypothetical protein
MTRRVTCRMVDQHGNRCTGEAIDANGEVLICIGHAAAVLRLVNIRVAATPKPAARTRRAA